MVERQSLFWPRQRQAETGLRAATLFVRHRVVDYAAWRRAYDDFGAVQKAKGVRSEAVYQAADDPNDVTITHDFASIREAQSFLASEELRQAVERAGVVGEPTVWIARKA